ncbi:hypothetical protein B0H34DRAFT_668138 [Crassisporium funariophilum]|nr:hypothetical protein B0H34DRAFT_668138 [Crassisporium funariophilum]
MANHGYISRDGKNISAMDLVRGLKACYGLSTFCATFLSFGGFIWLRKIRPITLHEIGKHNKVEHNASLVHHDTPEGEEFAPIEIDEKLVEALSQDLKPSAADIEASSNPSARLLMNTDDVARARIRREKECKPVDSLHAEVARGEMAIILGVWETKTDGKVGIPFDDLRRWLGQERLPDGWKPNHVQGLRDVIKRAKGIKLAVERLRAEESTAAAAATQETAKLDEKSGGL